MGDGARARRRQTCPDATGKSSWTSRAPSPWRTTHASPRILDEAGFADVAIEPCDVQLDFALGRGVDEAVSTIFAIGPTSRMLKGQSDAARAAAAADLRAWSADRAVGDRVPLPGAIWIVTARKPPR